MKLRDYITEGIVTSKERKELTMMIVKKKDGTVKIGKDTITFKNGNMSFKKSDSITMTLVDILDTLGYGFKQNKSGLEIKY